MGDQLEPIDNGTVLTQDVAWKTRWEQWTIETSCERKSTKSVLEARHDDDDDDDDDDPCRQIFNFFLFFFVDSFVSEIVFFCLVCVMKNGYCLYCPHQSFLCYF